MALGTTTTVVSGRNLLSHGHNTPDALRIADIQVKTWPCGRIVIGGSDYPYYAGDALSSGNNKPVIELLTKSLFTTFPQLEGLRIEHAWGGTMGFSLDFVPSVGVMGEHRNIYYGVTYNGEGVAFSQTAGRIIAELMAGQSSTLTDLFVVNHKLPYMGPQSLRLLMTRLYKAYLTRTAKKTVR
jgi:glycine/D-amino acid oxidase-like deaminating enzyme